MKRKAVYIAAAALAAGLTLTSVASDLPEEKTSRTEQAKDNKKDTASENKEEATPESESTPESEQGSPAGETEGSSTGTEQETPGTGESESTGESEGSQTPDEGGETDSSESEVGSGETPESGESETDAGQSETSSDDQETPSGESEGGSSSGQEGEGQETEASDETEQTEPEETEESAPETETEKKDNKKDKKKKDKKQSAAAVTDAGLGELYLAVSGYPVTDLTENEKDAYRYLREDLSLNKAAAAGVLANIYCESNFSSIAIGDGGTSLGLCQWHAERCRALIGWCQSQDYDYRSVEGQLHYLGYELENGYYSVYDYLLNVPDTEEGAYQAGYYFCFNFERPDSIQTRSDARGKIASSVYFAADLDSFLEEESEAETETESETEAVSESAEVPAPEDAETETESEL